MVECVEDFQEVPHATSETVRSPHQDDVKLTAVCSSEHLVKCRTLRFCATDFVTVFSDDFEPTLLCQSA
jgi:hypothetical protein